MSPDLSTPSTEYLRRSGSSEVGVGVLGEGTSSQGNDLSPSYFMIPESPKEVSG